MNLQSNVDGRGDDAAKPSDTVKRTNFYKGIELRMKIVEWHHAVKNVDAGETAHYCSEPDYSKHSFSKRVPHVIQMMNFKNT